MSSMVEIAKGVSLLSCKMIKANIFTSDALSPGMELKIDFNINFRKIDANGFPSGLESDVSIIANGGEAFAYEMIFRSLFGFPEGTTKGDAEDYLAQFGVTRAIDAIRSIVEPLSLATASGPVSLPPMAVSVDKSEWSE